MIICFAELPKNARILKLALIAAAYWQYAWSCHEWCRVNCSASGEQGPSPNSQERTGTLVSRFPGSA
jgi:hypothetical protein